MSRGVGQPSKPHVISHTSVKYTARMDIANKPKRIPRRLDFNQPRRPRWRSDFIADKTWEKCIVQSSFRSLSPPWPAMAVGPNLRLPRTVTAPARQPMSPHQTPAAASRVQPPLRTSRRQVPLLRELQQPAV